MPSSHLPFFEGRQGCWCVAKDGADAKQAERSLKGKGGGEGARDGCGFERVVGMERVDATGGASLYSVIT